MQDSSDAQLIAGHLGGDNAALDTLIRRYLGQVYGFVSRYVGDSSDADDITQEAFVRAWKHLKKFDQGKSFKTWIFSIAKNAALDFLKKKKTLPFSDFENEQGDNALVDSITDPAPLAPELLDRADLASLLDSVMQLLPPQQRMVLFLRYNDHLSFREIGEALNEPLDTVKSRHYRGLIALKKLLEGGNDAPNPPSQT